MSRSAGQAGWRVGTPLRLRARRSGSRGRAATAPSGPARAAAARRREPLLGARPPADLRLLAAASLLHGQGGAVGVPRGRRAADLALGVFRRPARRGGPRRAAPARQLLRAGGSSASTSRGRGRSSATRGRCSRAASDRPAGGRAGDPVRARHVRLVADEPPARARSSGASRSRSTASPRGRRGYAEAAEIVGAELVRLWRLAAGRPRAGLPPELSDGAQRTKALGSAAFALSHRRKGPTLTDRVATTQTRRATSGRLSEIAQVAVRHGFGYFFESHKLTDLLPAPARREVARARRASPSDARPAPARAARRARPDVRQVRAAPLDAARHRPAGHHRSSCAAPGRRAPVPVRRRRARDPRGPRALGRAALPRVRRDAGRGRVDRPGAPRDAAQRPSRRGQGAAPGRAAPDRGRPGAPLPGGAARAASGSARSTSSTARQLVDEFARSIRQELDYRLEARNAEVFHRHFAGHPHVRDPARLLELHPRARAHARVPRGHPARRPAARRLADGGAPPPRVPDGRGVDDDDLPPRLLPRRPAPGEHPRPRATAP